MTGQKGFGMIEVLVAVAILSIMALGMANMFSNQAQMGALLASQNSNMALGAAIRTQLARRESCIASLSQPSFPGGGNVAVRLGPNDATQLVQAGASLPAWKTNIDSLRLENVRQFGTTNRGRDVYLGDIMLQASSTDLKPGMRVQMKQFVASRLTFEVEGGRMVACYAGDAFSDTTQTLQQVCEFVTSPDGTPGEWIGGKCVVRDQRPETTCRAQGGGWTTAGCNMNPPMPANETCAKLGGSWGAQGCQIGAPQVTQIIQQVAGGGAPSGGGPAPGGGNPSGGGGEPPGSCGGSPHGSTRLHGDGCNYDRCISGVWITAGSTGNCSQPVQGGGM